MYNKPVLCNFYTYHKNPNFTSMKPVDKCLYQVNCTKQQCPCVMVTEEVVSVCTDKTILFIVKATGVVCGKIDVGARIYGITCTRFNT